MRPRIISISCLLLLVMMMAAQGIQKHEYWIDSDYGNRKTVSSSNTSISLKISTEGLSAGIHILNLWAQDTDGTWGSPSRMLFYVPASMSADATIGSCEYWIDSDYANRKSGTDGASMTDMIDISKLNPGVHFLNYQATNNFGDPGIIIRQPFFVPAIATDDAQIIRMDFWIDNDYENRVKLQGMPNIHEHGIDISKLSAGIHIFNCHAISFYDGFGDDKSAQSISRMLFYVPEHISKDVAIAEYEYWLDGDFAGKKTGTDTKEEYLITMDVSKLADGEHAFNFRAKNTDGVWGTIYTENFTIDGSITDDLIDFADKETEKLCVANWDTNGDGYLSKTEAAAVTSIGTVFKGTEITSFDELEYFTGLTKIEDQSFRFCGKLRSLKIPANVNSLGQWAFWNSSLEEIFIPQNLTDIHFTAFSFVPSLKYISVDVNNPVYDSRNNCNAIIVTATNTLFRACQNTAIPVDVTTLGRVSFDNVQGIDDFVVPNQIERIEAGAFGYSSISSITIPSTTSFIGQELFGGCSNLVTIKIDDSNPVYDSRDNCNAVIETATNTLLCGCGTTVIPSGIVKIEQRAFAYCESLKAITIPKTVTTIGAYAFDGCTGLSEVAIPDQVRVIDTGAFEACTNMTSVVVVKPEINGRQMEAIKNLKR